MDSFKYLEQQVYPPHADDFDYDHMNNIISLVTSSPFYKHGRNELSLALVLLFNTIIANGEYPSSWATGIIHPVHKKLPITCPIITGKLQ